MKSRDMFCYTEDLNLNEDRASIGSFVDCVFFLFLKLSFSTTRS